jgi:hypothetical protein
MKGTRIRVAMGLLAGVLSVLASVGAPAASRPIEARYLCTDGPGFAVARSAGEASVRYAGRTYELKRKPSSIGVKYIAADAALIVDGRSAVFVADDRPLFGPCLQATGMASK